MKKAISNEQPVFFVEGEKDADNLSKLGVCATTIAGGAGKWKDSLTNFFKHADLILVPDNDQPGLKGMTKIGTEIFSVVKRLRWLKLPNLPLKGDTSDWIEIEQGTSEKLRQVVEEKAFDWDNTKLQHFKNAFVPHTETEGQLIERLNQKHFFCPIGGKAVVVNEIFNETTKKHELTYSSPTDFKYRYENQKIFTQGRERNVADYWLKHPKRRQYERMNFLPNGEKVIGNSYNLWRGFAFSPQPSNPENPNDITKFRKFIEHLRYIIASENEEIYEYILDWMTQVVQEPTEKIGTSIVLRSDTQGTGKGTFINIFGELFGKHFLTINSPRHLLGHFNTHLIDNLILFADEAFWAGDKSSEGALKTLITEEDRLIEPKGKDAFQVKNFTRLMIASNKSWVVPTELEDRRFLIVDVSDKRKNDTQYFKMLRDQMNEGGYEALLWFLMNRKIKTNLRTLPNTEAKIVSKLQGMTPVQKWWHERLTDTYILEENTWEDCCSKQLVYENFSYEHDRQGYISREIFFRELYKLLPQKPQEFQYHRKREIVFPLHEDCCRFFENKFGILIEESD